MIEEFSDSADLIEKFVLFTHCFDRERLYHPDLMTGTTPRLALWLLWLNRDGLRSRIDGVYIQSDRQMIHPNTELRFIDAEIGHGVVATQFIPQGTITWVQDELDQKFSSKQVRSLGSLYIDQLDKYCFRDRDGQWILCWDHGRFVNHSFKSNCLTTAYNFEVAIRDIQAGEQLTDDYGYLNIMQPFHAMDEGCGRKVVYPDDLTRYHTEWDRKLSESWPFIPKVNQPLRPLLDEGVWHHVESVNAGKAEMESILKCYYKESDGCSDEVDSISLQPVS